jgi:hypothetical protein
MAEPVGVLDGPRRAVIQNGSLVYFLMRTRPGMNVRPGTRDPLWRVVDN